MLNLTSRKLSADRTLPGMESSGRRITDTIPPDLLHRRRAARRLMVDARHERNAVEQIIQLPAAGESLHFIVDGRYEPCDLIPATSRLSRPATIKRLEITTLGVNNDNVSVLANGMDQGKIGQCMVLVSGFFCRAHSPEFEFLRTEIEGRGGKTHAMGTHAKLILMEMTDGNWYTIEGSGNLRSCQSIEQFVMTNDRDLLLFHRGWIEDYVFNCSGKDKTTKRTRRQ